MLLVDLIFFALELCALAAFCYWGFHLKGAETWVRTLAGIGSPVLVAVFWGTFVAPKARVPVRPLVRFALQLLVFAAAAAVLHGSGQRKLATLFLLVAIVEVVLSHKLKKG
ncbi:YrdB family protein [Paenibacillus sp. MWE-103]|uniref:YrdB family protein n=1 Tax=Paenibacillus artemisiicola TaxID=1172618 RepID=A0ABS3WG47_9BACL|nr:YrdB family protein [Paenibacillus artemisiicola]MBO7747288.1 YrdB family protein [Paenibacillus artemisiicola]